MAEIDQFLRNLFDYDYWANLKTIESLAAVPEGVERPRKFVGHVIGAQRAWLARFSDPNPPAVQPWPVLSLEECSAAIDEMRGQWLALFEGLGPDGLERDLPYRNMKGQEFRTPIRDILTQLTLHGAYHRGQVALAIREAGGKPAATDYILFVRSKST